MQRTRYGVRLHAMLRKTEAGRLIEHRHDTATGAASAAGPRVVAPQS